MNLDLAAVAAAVQAAHPELAVRYFRRADLRLGTGADRLDVEDADEMSVVTVWRSGAYTTNGRLTRDRIAALRTVLDAIAAQLGDAGP